MASGTSGLPSFFHEGPHLTPLTPLPPPAETAVSPPAAPPSSPPVIVVATAVAAVATAPIAQAARISIETQKTINQLMQHEFAKTKPKYSLQQRFTRWLYNERALNAVEKWSEKRKIFVKNQLDIIRNTSKLTLERLNAATKKGMALAGLTDRYGNPSVLEKITLNDEKGITQTLQREFADVTKVAEETEAKLAHLAQLMEGNSQLIGIFGKQREELADNVIKLRENIAKAKTVYETELEETKKKELSIRYPNMPDEKGDKIPDKKGIKRAAKEALATPPITPRLSEKEETFLRDLVDGKISVKSQLNTLGDINAFRKLIRTLGHQAFTRENTKAKERFVILMMTLKSIDPQRITSILDTKDHIVKWRIEQATYSIPDVWYDLIAREPRERDLDQITPNKNIVPSALKGQFRLVITQKCEDAIQNGHPHVASQIKALAKSPRFRHMIGSILAEPEFSKMLQDVANIKKLRPEPVAVAPEQPVHIELTRVTTGVETKPVTAEELRVELKLETAGAASVAAAVVVPVPETGAPPPPVGTATGVGGAGAGIAPPSVGAAVVPKVGARPEAAPARAEARPLHVDVTVVRATEINALCKRLLVAKTDYETAYSKIPMDKDKASANLRLMKRLRHDLISLITPTVAIRESAIEKATDNKLSKEQEEIYAGDIENERKYFYLEYEKNAKTEASKPAGGNPIYSEILQFLKTDLATVDKILEHYTPKAPATTTVAAAAATRVKYKPLSDPKQSPERRAFEDILRQPEFDISIPVGIPPASVTEALSNDPQIKRLLLLLSWNMFRQGVKRNYEDYSIPKPPGNEPTEVERNLGMASILEELQSRLSTGDHAGKGIRIQVRFTPTEDTAFKQARGIVENRSTYKFSVARPDEVIAEPSVMLNVLAKLLDEELQAVKPLTAKPPTALGAAERESKRGKVEAPEEKLEQARVTFEAVDFALKLKKHSPELWSEMMQKDKSLFSMLEDVCNQMLDRGSTEDRLKAHKFLMSMYLSEGAKLSVLGQANTLTRKAIKQQSLALETLRTRPPAEYLRESSEMNQEVLDIGTRYQLWHFSPSQERVLNQIKNTDPSDPIQVEMLGIFLNSNTRDFESLEDLINFRVSAGLGNWEDRLIQDKLEAMRSELQPLLSGSHAEAPKGPQTEGQIKGADFLYYEKQKRKQADEEDINLEAIRVAQFVRRNNPRAFENRRTAGGTHPVEEPLGILIGHGTFFGRAAGWTYKALDAMDKAIAQHNRDPNADISPLLAETLLAFSQVNHLRTFPTYEEQMKAKNSAEAFKELVQDIENLENTINVAVAQHGLGRLSIEQQELFAKCKDEKLGTIRDLSKVTALKNSSVPVIKILNTLKTGVLLGIYNEPPELLTAVLADIRQLEDKAIAWKGRIITDAQGAGIGLRFQEFLKENQKVANSAYLEIFMRENQPLVRRYQTNPQSLKPSEIAQLRALPERLVTGAAAVLQAEDFGGLPITMPTATPKDFNNITQDAAQRKEKWLQELEILLYSSKELKEMSEAEKRFSAHQDLLSALAKPPTLEERDKLSTKAREELEKIEASARDYVTPTAASLPLASTIAQPTENVAVTFNILERLLISDLSSVTRTLSAPSVPKETAVAPTREDELKAAVILEDKEQDEELAKLSVTSDGIKFARYLQKAHPKLWEQLTKKHPEIYSLLDKTGNFVKQMDPSKTPGVREFTIFTNLERAIRNHTIGRLDSHTREALTALEIKIQNLSQNERVNDPSYQEAMEIINYNRLLHLNPKQLALQDRLVAIVNIGDVGRREAQLLRFDESEKAELRAMREILEQRKRLPLGWNPAEIELQFNAVNFAVEELSRINKTRLGQIHTSLTDAGIGVGVDVKVERETKGEIAAHVGVSDAKRTAEVMAQKPRSLTDDQLLGILASRANIQGPATPKTIDYIEAALSFGNRQDFSEDVAIYQNIRKNKIIAEQAERLVDGADSESHPAYAAAGAAYLALSALDNAIEANNRNPNNNTNKQLLLDFIRKTDKAHLIINKPAVQKDLPSLATNLPHIKTVVTNFDAFVWEQIAQSRLGRLTPEQDQLLQQCLAPGQLREIKGLKPAQVIELIEAMQLAVLLGTYDRQPVLLTSIMADISQLQSKLGSLLTPAALSKYYSEEGSVQQEYFTIMTFRADLKANADMELAMRELQPKMQRYLKSFGATPIQELQELEKALNAMNRLPIVGKAALARRAVWMQHLSKIRKEITEQSGAPKVAPKATEAELAPITEKLNSLLTMSDKEFSKLGVNLSEVLLQDKDIEYWGNDELARNARLVNIRYYTRFMTSDPAQVMPYYRAAMVELGKIPKGSLSAQDYAQLRQEVQIYRLEATAKLMQKGIDSELEKQPKQRLATWTESEIRELGDPKLIEQAVQQNESLLLQRMMKDPTNRDITNELILLYRKFRAKESDQLIEDLKETVEEAIKVQKEEMQPIARNADSALFAELSEHPERIDEIILDLEQNWEQFSPPEGDPKAIIAQLRKQAADAIAKTQGDSKRGGGPTAPSGAAAATSAAAAAAVPATLTTQLEYLRKNLQNTETLKKNFTNVFIALTEAINLWDKLTPGTQKNGVKTELIGFIDTYIEHSTLDVRDAIRSNLFLLLPLIKIAPDRIEAMNKKDNIEREQILIQYGTLLQILVNLKSLQAQSRAFVLAPPVRENPFESPIKAQQALLRSQALITQPYSAQFGLDDELNQILSTQSLVMHPEPLLIFSDTTVSDIHALIKSGTPGSLSHAEFQITHTLMDDKLRKELSEKLIEAKLEMHERIFFNLDRFELLFAQAYQAPTIDEGLLTKLIEIARSIPEPHITLRNINTRLESIIHKYRSQPPTTPQPPTGRGTPPPPPPPPPLPTGSPGTSGPPTTTTTTATAASRVATQPPLPGLPSVPGLIKSTKDQGLFIDITQTKADKAFSILKQCVQIWDRTSNVTEKAAIAAQIEGFISSLNFQPYLRDQMRSDPILMSQLLQIQPNLQILMTKADNTEREVALRGYRLYLTFSADAIDAIAEPYRSQFRADEIEVKYGARDLQRSSFVDTTTAKHKAIFSQLDEFEEAFARGCKASTPDQSVLDTLNRTYSSLGAVAKQRNLMGRREFIIKKFNAMSATTTTPSTGEAPPPPLPGLPSVVNLLDQIQTEPQRFPEIAPQLMELWKRNPSLQLDPIEEMARLRKLAAETLQSQVPADIEKAKERASDLLLKIPDNSKGFDSILFELEAIWHKHPALQELNKPLIETLRFTTATTSATTAPITSSTTLTPPRRPPTLRPLGAILKSLEGSLKGESPSLDNLNSALPYLEEAIAIWEGSNSEEREKIQKELRQHIGKIIQHSDINLRDAMRRNVGLIGPLLVIAPGSNDQMLKKDDLVKATFGQYLKCIVNLKFHLNRRYFKQTKREEIGAEVGKIKAEMLSVEGVVGGAAQPYQLQYGIPDELTKISELMNFKGEAPKMSAATAIETTAIRAFITAGRGLDSLSRAEYLITHRILSERDRDQLTGLLIGAKQQIHAKVFDALDEFERVFAKAYLSPTIDPIATKSLEELVGIISAANPSFVDQRGLDARLKLIRERAGVPPITGPISSPTSLSSTPSATRPLSSTAFTTSPFGPPLTSPAEGTRLPLQPLTTPTTTTAPTTATFAPPPLRPTAAPTTTTTTTATTTPVGAAPPPPPVIPPVPPTLLSIFEPLTGLLKTNTPESCERAFALLQQAIRLRKETVPGEAQRAIDRDFVAYYQNLFVENPYLRDRMRSDMGLMDQLQEINPHLRNSIQAADTRQRKIALDGYGKFLNNKLAPDLISYSGLLAIEEELKLKTAGEREGKAEERPAPEEPITRQKLNKLIFDQKLESYEKAERLIALLPNNANKTALLSHLKSEKIKRYSNIFKSLDEFEKLVAKSSKEALNPTELNELKQRVGQVPEPFKGRRGLVVRNDILQEKFGKPATTPPAGGSTPPPGSGPGAGGPPPPSGAGGAPPSGPGPAPSTSSPRTPAAPPSSPPPSTGGAPPSATTTTTTTQASATISAPFGAGPKSSTTPALTLTKAQQEARDKAKTALSTLRTQIETDPYYLTTYLKYANGELKILKELLSDSDFKLEFKKLQIARLKATEKLWASGEAATLEKMATSKLALWTEEEINSLEDPSLIRQARSYNVRPPPYVLQPRSPVTTTTAETLSDYDSKSLRFWNDHLGDVSNLLSARAGEKSVNQVFREIEHNLDRWKSISPEDQIAIQTFIYTTLLRHPYARQKIRADIELLNKLQTYAPETLKTLRTYDSEARKEALESYQSILTYRTMMMGRIINNQVERKEANYHNNLMEKTLDTIPEPYKTEFGIKEEAAAFLKGCEAELSKVKQTYKTADPSAIDPLIKQGTVESLKSAETLMSDYSYQDQTTLDLRKKLNTAKIQLLGKIFADVEEFELRFDTAFTRKLKPDQVYDIDRLQKMIDRFPGTPTHKDRLIGMKRWLEAKMKTTPSLPPTLPTTTPSLSSTSPRAATTAPAPSTAATATAEPPQATPRVTPTIPTLSSTPPGPGTPVTEPAATTATTTAAAPPSAATTAEPPPTSKPILTQTQLSHSQEFSDQRDMSDDVFLGFFEVWTDQRIGSLGKDEVGLELAKAARQLNIRFYRLQMTKTSLYLMTHYNAAMDQLNNLAGSLTPLELETQMRILQQSRLNATLNLWTYNAVAGLEAVPSRKLKPFTKEEIECLREKTLMDQAEQCNQWLSKLRSQPPPTTPPPTGGGTPPPPPPPSGGPGPGGAPPSGPPSAGGPTPPGPGPSSAPPSSHPSTGAAPPSAQTTATLSSTPPGPGTPVTGPAAPTTTRPPPPPPPPRTIIPQTLFMLTSAPTTTEELDKTFSQLEDLLKQWEANPNTQDRNRAEFKKFINDIIKYSYLRDKIRAQIGLKDKLQRVEPGLSTLMDTKDLTARKKALKNFQGFSSDMALLRHILAHKDGSKPLTSEQRSSADTLHLQALESASQIPEPFRGQFEIEEDLKSFTAAYNAAIRPKKEETESKLERSLAGESAAIRKLIDERTVGSLRQADLFIAYRKDNTETRKLREEVIAAKNKMHQDIFERMNEFESIFAIASAQTHPDLRNLSRLEKIIEMIPKADAVRLQLKERLQFLQAKVPSPTVTTPLGSPATPAPTSLSSGSAPSISSIPASTTTATAAPPPSTSDFIPLTTSFGIPGSDLTVRLSKEELDTRFTPLKRQMGGIVVRWKSLTPEEQTSYKVQKEACIERIIQHPYLRDKIRADIELMDRLHVLDPEIVLKMNKKDAIDHGKAIENYTNFLAQMTATRNSLRGKNKSKPLSYKETKVVDENKQSLLSFVARIPEPYRTQFGLAKEMAIINKAIENATVTVTESKTRRAEPETLESFLRRVSTPAFTETMQKEQVAEPKAPDPKVQHLRNGIRKIRYDLEHNGVDVTQTKELIALITREFSKTHMTKLENEKIKQELLKITKDIEPYIKTKQKVNKSVSNEHKIGELIINGHLTQAEELIAHRDGNPTTLNLQRLLNTAKSEIQRTIFRELKQFEAYYERASTAETPAKADMEGLEKTIKSLSEYPTVETTRRDLISRLEALRKAKGLAPLSTASSAPPSSSSSSSSRPATPPRIPAATTTPPPAAAPRSTVAPPIPPTTQTVVTKDARLLQAQMTTDENIRKLEDQIQRAPKEFESNPPPPWTEDEIASLGEDLLRTRARAVNIRIFQSTMLYGTPSDLMRNYKLVLDQLEKISSPRSKEEILTQTQELLLIKLREYWNYDNKSSDLLGLGLFTPEEIEVIKDEVTKKTAIESNEKYLKLQIETLGGFDVSLYESDLKAHYERYYPEDKAKERYAQYEREATTSATSEPPPTPFPSTTATGTAPIDQPPTLSSTPQPTSEPGRVVGVDVGPTVVVPGVRERADSEEPPPLPPAPAPIEPETVTEGPAQLLPTAPLPFATAPLPPPAPTVPSQTLIREGIAKIQADWMRRNIKIDETKERIIQIKKLLEDPAIPEIEKRELQRNLESIEQSIEPFLKSSDTLISRLIREGTEFTLMQAKELIDHRPTPKDETTLKLEEAYNAALKRPEIRAASTTAPTSLSSTRTTTTAQAVAVPPAAPATARPFFGPPKPESKEEAEGRTKPLAEVLSTIETNLARYSAAVPEEREKLKSKIKGEVTEALNTRPDVQEKVLSDPKLMDQIKSIGLSPWLQVTNKTARANKLSNYRSFLSNMSQLRWMLAAKGSAKQFTPEQQKQARKYLYDMTHSFNNIPEPYRTQFGIKEEDIKALTAAYEEAEIPVAGTTPKAVKVSKQAETKLKKSKTKEIGAFLDRDFLAEMNRIHSAEDRGWPPELLTIRNGLRKIADGWFNSETIDIDKLNELYALVKSALKKAVASKDFSKTEKARIKELQGEFLRVKGTIRPHLKGTDGSFETLIKQEGIRPLRAAEAIIARRSYKDEKTLRLREALTNAQIELHKKIFEDMNAFDAAFNKANTSNPNPEQIGVLESIIKRFQGSSTDADRLENRVRYLREKKAKASVASASSSSSSSTPATTATSATPRPTTTTMSTPTMPIPPTTATTATSTPPSTTISTTSTASTLTATPMPLASSAPVSGGAGTIAAPRSPPLSPPPEESKLKAEEAPTLSSTTTPPSNVELVLNKIKEDLRNLDTVPSEAPWRAKQAINEFITQQIRDNPEIRERIESEPGLIDRLDRDNVLNLKEIYYDFTEKQQAAALEAYGKFLEEKTNLRNLIVDRSNKDKPLSERKRKSAVEHLRIMKAHADRIPEPYKTQFGLQKEIAIYEKALKEEGEPKQVLKELRQAEEQLSKRILMPAIKYDLKQISESIEGTADQVLIAERMLSKRSSRKGKVPDPEIIALQQKLNARKVSVQRHYLSYNIKNWNDVFNKAYRAKIPEEGDLKLLQSYMAGLPADVVKRLRMKERLQLLEERRSKSKDRPRA